MTDDWQDIGAPASDDWHDVTPVSSSTPAGKVQDSVKQLKDAAESPPFYERFAEGAKRGFLQRGVGMGQLLNDVGVGDKIGLPPNEAYSDYEKGLEKEGKGTGAAGFAGELVGDPLNYAMGPMAPVKGAGLISKGLRSMGKGATMGAGYGATAPSTDDQGLGERAIGTAKAGASGALMFPAVQAAGAGAGKLAGSVIDKFKTKSSFNPTEFSDAISQNYHTQKQAENDLYNKMRFFAHDKNGEPHTLDANDLQRWMDNTINYFGDTVSPSEQKAVRTLKMMRDRRIGNEPQPFGVYPETGKNSLATKDQLAAQDPYVVQPIDKISYTDLVDIKQALNEGFNPSQFANKGDRALGSLRSRVDDLLNRAGENHPEFGNALADANAFHGNEISSVFRNDTLGKFWKPDDYHNFLQGKSTLDDVDAAGRMRNMMNNIKTPEHLQAVAQALPQDMRQPLVDAVWDKIKTDAAMPKERLVKFGTAIMDMLKGSPVKAAKNAYRGVAAKPELDALGEVAQKWATKPLEKNPIIAPLLGTAAVRSEADEKQVPKITFHPRSGYYDDQRQADGGRTYSAAEWLTLVRKHGKKHGITASHRSDPEYIKRMKGIVSAEKPPKTKYMR